jgi:YidC/Oxa1 family membrane protein insertase
MLTQRVSQSPVPKELPVGVIEERAVPMPIETAEAIQPTVSPLSAEAQDVVVETDLLKVVFTTQEARIKGCRLKEYGFKTTDIERMLAEAKKQRDEDAIRGLEERIVELSTKAEGEQEPVELVSHKSYPLALAIRGQEGLAHAIYKPDKEKMVLDQEAPKGQMAFSHTTPQGLKVTKAFTFCNSKYTIDVAIELANLTARAVEVSGYNLSWGPGIGSEQELVTKRDIGYLGAVSYIDGGRIRDRVNKVKGRIERSGSVAWIALKNKYFMVALIPQFEAELTTIKKDNSDKLSIALQLGDFSLPPKSAVTHEYSLYVGPQEYNRLKAKGIKLEEAIDLGWPRSLSVLMLHALKLFHRLIPNWGWAIVLLTVLIKVIFLPLTRKSFISMRAMQVIQPQMNALRKKYSQDPQRLQKELMKLYRENRVNPMGGCLPLLFQLPIFWALFMTLRSAIELRGATFIPHWIKDLSLPDTVTHIATLPLNILPLLMGFTMFIQQRMTTGATAGNPQAKMMRFMPIFMIFIFYNFPSGLVLYWLVNNILTIGEQYLITKRASRKPNC